MEDFTGENIRIVISQGLSLEYMVSLALDKLPLNVWEGGDMYDGCLLTTMLGIDPNFWKENTDLFYELKEVMTILFSQIETFQNGIDPLWKQIENIV